ncbi:DegV family protein [Peptoniphilaceae bacterium SGI.131]
MTKIRLFADSSIDLPQEIIDRIGLTIIPVNITMGDEEYVDLIDITADDVLNYAERNKVLPKTSSATYTRVEEALGSLKDDEKGIYVLISAKASTTAQMIGHNVLKANNWYDKVTIIDTKSLSGGSGLIAIKAYELIEEGKDFDTIVDELNLYVEKINGSFLVDKLDFLYYGGRVSQFSLLLSGGLKIKPMIKFTDGEMKAFKKYRGSLEKTIAKYTDEVLADDESIDDSRVIIAYTRMDEKTLREAVERVKAKNIFKEVLVAKASATITVHGGPNVFSLFFANK